MAKSTTIQHCLKIKTLQSEGCKGNLVEVTTIHRPTWPTF